MLNPESLLKVITEASFAAAQAIEKSRKSFMFREKSPRELVTNCDIASESAIIETIQKHYPDSVFVSEEIGHLTGEQEFVWLIDPIDGTHNFIYKLPFYGISITLLYQGQPHAAGIYLPEFKKFFHAIRGKGSFLNNDPIRVSKRTQLKNAMIAYSNSFYRDPRLLQDFEAFISKCFTLRIFGSAVSDIAMVAEGKIDSRIFHSSKLVDFAPALVLIPEAGGKVTTFSGQVPDLLQLKDEDLVVSNGYIHESILEIFNHQNRTGAL
jgi:myo-inositol-1(or 4)-monophosphatase